MTDHHRPMDEDERYDLVAHARSVEARNRPSTLLALGALVLIAAAALFALAYLGQQSSARDMRSQERRLDRLVELAADHRALTEQAAADNDGCLDPVPNLLSRLETLARQAGLDPPNPPNATPRPLGGGSDLQRLRYPYQVRDRSIEKVLTWIERATDRIPCLEIDSLQITPSERTQLWTVDVVFSRLERIP